MTAVMETFDHIVIGAGSAGCAIASRLSEDASRRVLLLEAGGRDTSQKIHVPGGYFWMMYDPKFSWCYETEAVPGSNNRPMVWPRGKVLGGSSSINGLIYIRGQQQDYDHWRQLGNTGWSFDDVLPFFRKAEDNERGGDDFHGADGPLQVSDIRGHRAICESLIDAAEARGIPRNPDFNGAVQEGAGYYQTTTRNGRRSSAAVGYLKRARNRANLKIETSAMTSRILIEDGRAVGVRYLQDGREIEARATGDIVLSGGAINSPQLLQISGIGPGALLQKIGVDVIVDLPGVGENLQDHYQARLVHQTHPGMSLNEDVAGPLRRARVGLEYILKRTGPLTVAAGQVGIFLKTRPELATPDIQAHFICFSADNPTEQKLHDYPGVTFSVCQLRPESRGHVRARSSDTNTRPEIQPNFLDTPNDCRTMVDGLKTAREIAGEAAYAQHVKAETLPGPHVTSDEDLLDYVRETGGTIYHPSGTCKMGPDPMAVVDERLRVRGIDNLRVADCSIMPTVVSGNTNAPAIMIGEKCAAMIREDSRA